MRASAEAGTPLRAGHRAVPWLPALGLVVTLGLFARQAPARAAAPPDSVHVRAPSSPDTLVRRESGAGSRDRWLRVGEKLLRLGKYHEAAGAFEKARVARPNDPAVLSRLAEAKRRLGQPARAIELYQTALRLKPGHVEFRLGLAGAYAEAGDYERAQRTYRSILSERPGERRALLGAARAYGWDGEYADAIAMYERYLAFYEESVEGLLGLARVYSWNNQFGESVDTYHRILSTDPRNREARLGLARVLSWQGELERAKAIYVEMLVDSPDDLVILLDYAKILAWREEFGQAREIYDRILEADRENLDAMLGLARVVSWQGDLDRAEEIYDRILEREPDNREAVMGKIQVLYWGGRPFKARDFLRTYPPETVSDPEYRSMAASVRLELGDPEGALEILEQDPAATTPRRESLLKRIRSSLEPTYFTDVQFLHDSENRQIVRIPHRFTFHPAPGRDYRLEIAHAALNEDHREGISNLDVLLGYRQRLNPKSTIRLQTGISHFNPGYSTGVWALGWTYKVHDGWEIGLGADRDTFGWTARAIEQGIVVTSLSLDVVHTWWRNWSLRLNAMPALYNDDNRRIDLGLTLGHTFLEVPYNFTVSYHYRYFSYQWNLDNGYFDPARYAQYSLIGEKGLSLGRRGFGSLVLEGGLFSFSGAPVDGLFKTRLHVEWEALDALSFQFDFELFNSALRFDSGAYGSASYRLGLRYNL